MSIEIGKIEAICRYPVKSMRGERLDAAELGWHGVEGDRRLAFRRINERGGNPWLSASRMHELITYTPLRLEENRRGLPSHVRTPAGEELDVFSDELAAEIGARIGSPVQMMQLRQGIFDEAAVSVITSATVAEIGRVAGRDADVRRFRPNIVVRTVRDLPFEEDAWVGGALALGEGDDAPVVAVTQRDKRCLMINLDPDDASAAPEVMKSCVEINENCAGVYGAVTRIGSMAVGQPVFLRR